MNEIVKIVSPSYKRAGNVKVLGAIDNVTLVVPQSQLKDYQTHYPEADIVAHPDIDGISMTRQWIYDTFGDVFMLDDDVKSMKRLYVPSGEEATVSPSEAYEIVQATAQMAKDLGTYMFGFNPQPNPMHFKPHEPFALTKSQIPGWSTGLLKGSQIFYPTGDKDKSLCEDIFANLLCGYFHRYWLIDNRFMFYAPGMRKNEGGVQEYRTLELERKSAEFLKETFGSAVKVEEKDGVVSKRIKMPY